MNINQLLNKPTTIPASLQRLPVRKIRMDVGQERKEHEAAMKRHNQLLGDAIRRREARLRQMNDERNKLIRAGYRKIEEDKVVEMVRREAKRLGSRNGVISKILNNKLPPSVSVCHEIGVRALIFASKTAPAIRSYWICGK